MDKISSDFIKEFENDCKIIDLKKEYPQYQGTVKYAVISRLTEDELIRSYCQVLVQYQPYFVLNNNIGDVFHEYWKNEKKILYEIHTQHRRRKLSGRRNRTVHFRTER